MFKGVHLVNEPTSPPYQPDHVIGFYDIMRFTVTGSVGAGAGDHKALQVNIFSRAKKIPRQMWSRREIITDHGDELVISKRLQVELENLNVEHVDQSVRDDMTDTEGQVLLDAMYTFSCTNY